MQGLSIVHDENVLIFASDIHLMPDIESATEPSGFLRALEHLLPQNCSHLFILGDLFETWVGDDVDFPARQALSNSLALLRKRCESPLELYLMHGNRDFLLGCGACEAWGAKLIEASFTIEGFGRRVGLVHGDELCTDDKAYQAFRSQVRDAMWQGQFLSRSINERQQLALSLRAQSEAAKRLKSMTIMDVNQDTVNHHMHQQRLDILIHGHTHRPAVHRQGVTRWVLPDWDKGQQRGGWLRWDRSGFHPEGPFGPWA